MIEKILPQNKARIRILEAIFSNPGINITEIIRKARVSPNLVIKYVNDLVSNGVLIEKRIGGTKKKHIRLLYPSMNGLGIKIFSMIEVEKRMVFIRKYPWLGPLFEQMAELLDKKNMDFALVYGSFARLSADKESDLDLLVVGKGNVSNALSDILVTSGREYSVKIETKAVFLKNLREKSLFRNIIKDHVVIFGESEFLSLIKDYIGSFKE